MSEQADDQAQEPSVSTAPAHSRWRAIPKHLGRARTSTLVLSVLFVAIGGLYLNVRPETVATTPAGGGNSVQQPATTTTVAPTTTAPPTTTEPTEPTSEEPTSEEPTTTETTGPGSPSETTTRSPTTTQQPEPTLTTTTPTG